MSETSVKTPAIHTIEVERGLTLGYRELGSGSPVLLLHGWPTSSFLWRRVMTPIARSNRVIALDLPGFGASDKPVDGRYDFPDFERAIDTLLATLEIDRLALAGHDLGGPIAVHWALDRPGRATRVALLNTLLYPEFSKEIFEFVTMLRTPDSRDRATSAEGLAEFMRLGMAVESNVTEDMLAGVRAPFASDDARLALARAGIGLQPETFADIAARLPSLDMPVRVVYGEQDRILPDVADTFARLQRDLPHAQITSLPDCGHFLQEDQPDRVGELLAEFFGSG